MRALWPIQEAREAYVGFYRECLRRSRAEHPRLASEVMVQASAPEELPELYRTLRVDLVWKEDEEPRISQVQGGLSEEPGRKIASAVRVGPMEVQVAPLAWDACAVHFLHESEPDLGPLEDWFNKWLDKEDTRQPDDDGLCGVVHSLERPRREGGGWAFEVDFGSAPLEAFIELVETLRGLGAREIRVGAAGPWTLVAGTPWGQRLRETPLDAEGFVSLMLEALGQVPGVSELRRDGPMALKYKTPDGGDAGAYLDNLWVVVAEASPDRREQEVGRWLRLQREMIDRINGDAQIPDLEALRPVVKGTAFVEAVRQQASPAQNAAGPGPGDAPPRPDPLAWQPLVADLWIVYVWDRPDGMAFLTADEPGQWELSPEELHQRAIKNYLSARPDVQVRGEHGLFFATTGDCYDASLLLDDAFWQQAATQVAGDLVVCAPARDMLMFTGTEELRGLASMRHLAQKVLSSAHHTISGTMLRRVDGRWEVFAPPAEPTPEPIPEPAPAKAQPVAEPNIEPMAEPIIEPAAPPAPQAEPPAPPGKTPWWKFWA